MGLIRQHEDDEALARRLQAEEDQVAYLARTQMRQWPGVVGEVWVIPMPLVEPVQVGLRLPAKFEHEPKPESESERQEHHLMSILYNSRITNWMAHW